MAFSFHFKYQKTLHLKVSPKDVFLFLKDYSQAVPNHFPGIHQFRETKPQVFAWEFEPMNYGGKTITISFSTRFDENTDGIEIVSVPQEGNTRLEGHWLIQPSSVGSDLDLLFHLDFEVPLPALTKSVVTRLASSELLKLFDRYAKNLEKHFC